MNIVITFLLGVFLVIGNASAATLSWDRNSESDMKDYQVYACFTPNCVLVKSPSTLLPGTIPQTTLGSKPSAIVDLTNKQGFIGVSARDQSTNESGLSVPLPFDQVAPSIPANLTLQ